MSQLKITLQIQVNDLESVTGNTEAVSDEWVAIETGTELYRFCESEHRGTYGPFNPWQLRTEFLGWKLKEWQSLFVMAGAFGTPYISRNDFQEWQALMRRALLLPSREWRSLAEEFDPLKVERLRGKLPIEVDWDSEPATATLLGLSPLDSMIASIQVDKLQGAEFRECARPDCISEPFRVGARHKIYHDPACAHLVAVRADRKRKADAKRANSGKGKKAGKTSER